ncbi:MAG: TonB-dependent receptor [Alphaproteobacteria bacterium]|nr:TonB-dependent receptor [Alphaproteobacteria bacterium]
MKTKQTHKQHLLSTISCAVFTAGIFSPIPAYADVDTIVVTAQKREQDLQKVPLSVSAFSGDSLAELQIVNLKDLRGFAPNLYIEPALGNETVASIYMRGLGQINPSFFFDAPVPVYVDGVYSARAFGALVDLFDIERVEVLRGPQGTLFGRNASAGAIQVITKSPPLEDVDAAANAGYGSKDQVNLNASVGVPIVKDKVGARFALTYRRNDGFMTNTVDGAKSFSDNILAGRASVLFALNDTTEFVLRGDFLRDRSDPPGASAFNPDPDGDPFTFTSNFTDAEAFNQTDTFGFSGTLKSEFDGFNLTSITAYRNVFNTGMADGDGRAFPPLVFENLGQTLDEWQFTQEVFLTGDSLGGTDIEWTAGVFYLHEINDSDFSISILPFIPATRQFFQQNTNALGAYGQVTYPLTDRLDVTGGARYTWDSKDFMANQILASTGAAIPSFNFDDNTSVYRWTWDASLNYAATDDINLYARAGTGFRAGNFNGNAFSGAAIVSGALRTETVFNVEGGFKSQWFDNQLRLNATYFYQEVTDIQFELLTPSGITNFSATATLQGVELEVVATPFDGLDIFGNLGTLKDKVLGGGQLPRAAAYTYQVGFNYLYPLPNDNGSIRVGANYAYTDDYLQGRPDDILRAIDGFGVLDASATYEAPGGRWSFTISGANLTNEFYQISSFNIPGLVTIQTPNRPRTWLATIGFKY